MTPTPSGHISLFSLVFFSLKSPLEIVRQQSREKFAVLSLKPWSDVVKIPIYLTWAISYDLMFQPKHGPYAESLKRAFPGFSTLLTNGASRFLFLKGKLKVLEALPKPLKNSYKQTNKQTERMNKMESRFFEPPREMKIGLKNRKFENSKVL